MDSRLLPMAVAALGVVAVPGPGRVVAMGWLGTAPSVTVLLVLAAVAFVVLTGGALLIWKILTRHWPPREAVGVLVIVVAARVILDVVRMMGLWILQDRARTRTVLSRCLPPRHRSACRMRAQASRGHEPRAEHAEGP